MADRATILDARPHPGSDASARDPRADFVSRPLQATPDPRVPPARRVAVEICVDDVEGALAAEREGADRIELCAALSEGGLTPSLGLARVVLDRVRRVGVHVMVRPRGGDFLVGDAELEVMLADIRALCALPRAPAVSLGLVFGALTPDHRVDRETLARLMAACGPVPVTFHRAFDLVPDPAAALDLLRALGVRRVLTSGGAPTAEAGTAALARLVERARDDIAILAGGGVRAWNARALVDRTGVREIHLRAMRDRPGRPPVTCAAEVAAVVRAVAA